MTAPLNTPPDFSALTVAPVDKATARDICIERHYSHKWNSAFGTRNYGVFRDGDLLGVAVYGNAMNPAAWRSVTTTPAAACTELNRLWIDDSLGGNTETWLMGRSFRQLRADGVELVQSFADGRLGVGTIYQAANFTYHGFHETVFLRDAVTGTVLHTAPFSNTASARAMLTRNLLLTQPGRMSAFTVRTYRYLHPLTKRARHGILPPALPYPKDRAGERPLPAWRPAVTQVARSVAIAEKFGHAGAGDLRRLLATLTDDVDAAVDLQHGNRWVAALPQAA